MKNFLIYLQIFLLNLISFQTAFGQANTFVINEADGINQNGRIISFGRLFKDGDIIAGLFPQPLVNGQTISSWQADCKNWWASGSPKFCIISYVQPTLAISTSYPGTFTSNVNTCSGGCAGGVPSVYLSRAQMLAFNSGNWGGRISVSGLGSTTVNTDAATMLAASDPASNTFGDCKNDYWLKGPVITAVILQDCTATSAFDFGWHWVLGTGTMSSPVTGNATTATNHPIFVASFQSDNRVQLDEVLSLPWTTRFQDQVEDISFSTGSIPSVQWSHTGARKLTDVTATVVAGVTRLTSASALWTSNDRGTPVNVCFDGPTCPQTGNNQWGRIEFVRSSTVVDMNNLFTNGGGTALTGTGLTAIVNEQVAGTVKWKTFWSGVGEPGHIRVDPNFDYLSSTGAFPKWMRGPRAFVRLSGGGGKGAWARITARSGVAVSGSGGLINAEVVIGGTNYTSPPSCLISGYPGTGATCHVNIAGGAVTSITLDSPGSGYIDIGLNPDTVSFSPSGVTAYTDWENGKYSDIGTRDLSGDRGEIGGDWGTFASVTDFSQNSEGKPLQREELAYLYSISYDPLIPNGRAAKTWNWLTGEIDANPTTTLKGVVGGGGMWYGLGNAPMHFLEGKISADVNQPSGNSFYCVNFTSIDATVATSGCGTPLGVINNATGKIISRHTHSGLQMGDWQYSAVGSFSFTPGGWLMGTTDHGQDWAFLHYILTGKYPAYMFMLDDAALAISAPSPAVDPLGGGRIFGFVNPQGGVLRAFTWGMQNIGRCAWIAVDGTPENSYCNAMLNSNLATVKGILGNTNNSQLKPSSSQCGFNIGTTPCSFNMNTANRWDYGRYVIMSICRSTGGTCNPIANTLHSIAPGQEPVAGDQISEINSNATGFIANWMYHVTSIVMDEIRDMGFTQAAEIGDELHQSLVEKANATTYNPFLLGVADEGNRYGSPPQVDSLSGYLPLDPFIPTYAARRAAMNDADIFNWDFRISNLNFTCGDHGHSDTARANGMYLRRYPVTSTIAECPPGGCKSDPTIGFLNTEDALFDSVPISNTSCPALGNPLGDDSQVPYAFDIQPVTSEAVTLVSCSLAPSVSTIDIGGNQVYTSIGTYSDASTGDLTGSLSLVSSDTGVGTVVSQTINAIGSGTTNITGSVGVITCSPVGVLTVNNVAVNPNKTIYHSIGGGRIVR